MKKQISIGIRILAILTLIIMLAYLIVELAKMSTKAQIVIGSVSGLIFFLGVLAEKTGYLLRAFWKMRNATHPNSLTARSKRTTDEQRSQIQYSGKDADRLVSHIENTLMPTEPYLEASTSIEADAYLQELKRDWEYHPSNPYMLWKLAHRYAELKAYHQAVRAYNMLLDKRPELHDARMELIDCYIKLAMWDKALAELSYLKTIPRFFEDAKNRINKIRQHRVSELIKLEWRLAPDDVDRGQ